MTDSGSGESDVALDLQHVVLLLQTSLWVSAGSQLVCSAGETFRRWRLQLCLQKQAASQETLSISHCCSVM